MKNLPSYLIILLVLFPLLSSAQFYKKKINQLDENQKKIGLWKTYWDKEETIPMTSYHFINGHETGVCKEYNSKGKIRLKFRYDKTRIRVKYYYENRKLEKKGWAKWDITEVEMHYYWEGKWKFFNEDRKLKEIIYYKNGMREDNLTSE
jgi:antitoxin component YwqK of YwqJK toxin-antitoxin module